MCVCVCVCVLRSLNVEYLLTNKYENMNINYNFVYKYALNHFFKMKPLLFRFTTRMY